MAIVNIFLDFCLIFGKLGFPEMGIGGAALASFFAEVAAFIFFIIYSYITLKGKDFGMFKIHKLESELMKRILKVATPTMVQKLFSFGVWFIFFIMIEKMGETATGITSIVRSIYMILVTPCFAFSTTTNTLVSRTIGAGHPEQVFDAIIKIIKNCLLCTLPIIIILAIIPMQVISIYTEDLNLAMLAIPSIYVICVSAIFQVVGNSYFEAVSGTGNTSAALYLETSILVIYTIYVFLMTKFSSGVQWVWTAEILYGGLLAIVCYTYMKMAKWNEKRI